jgi:hypothetical protein
VIIVHYPIDTEPTAEAVSKGRLARKILDRAELAGLFTIAIAAVLRK